MPSDIELLSEAYKNIRLKKNKQTSPLGQKFYLGKFDLKVGDTFNTSFETGCKVASLPDDMGNFEAYDSDGILCSFNTKMIIPNSEAAQGFRVPHSSAAQREKELGPNAAELPTSAQLAGYREQEPGKDEQIKAVAHEIMKAIQGLSWPQAFMVSAAITCAQSSEDFKRDYGTRGVSELQDVFTHLLQGSEWPPK